MTALAPNKSGAPDRGPATGETVNLSLVSHTNAGKTTLVRTLLGRDVGEVRDAAHVTDEASAYVMLQHAGDTLMLWDTPGFGDTARLLRRLKLSSNPLGWLFTQVWDRYRERPLWSSQQAVRNARDHADVVLYLVNASEDPADAGYMPLELEILEWIGKPVVLLLNQMGPPREDATQEEERWSTHLRDYAVVKGALTLDAFARCWVQESTLLRTVASLLPEAKQAASIRLSDSWETKNLDRFHGCMTVLADELGAVAADRETFGAKNWRDKVVGPLRELQKTESPEGRRAMQALAKRLDARVRASTEKLIEAHGLSGRAVSEVLSRAQGDYATTAPVETGVAAVFGGLVSGAAGGLAADVAAGGLTLGGGMLVGGVLGALAAGGAARGYNYVKGDKAPSVRWSKVVFQSLVANALLRYLAVAHYGRGRGDYEEGEHPAFWRAAVQEHTERRAADISAIWEQGKAAAEPEALAEGIKPLLTSITIELLVQFYPDARGLFSDTAPNLERQIQR
jgi:GTPase SAR1 family protein